MTVDDQVREALGSSGQEGGVFGVATYQGESVDVAVTPSGSLTFRGEGEVQGSGSATVVGVGASLVPRAQADPLATFGQELSLWRTVRVRTESWLIPLGVYRITRSGESFERFRESTVLDWAVSLSFSDRFKQIRDDDFLAVEGPKAGSTVWDEVRRLSPIPVQEALGDAMVPASTVYESRLKAITVLIEMLGGSPHLTREGVLTARPRDAWLTETEPVAVLDGAISWSSEMTDDFFNQVQVMSSSDASIVAYARIDNDSNPLSVNRAGGRTYKHSSPIYGTQQAAQAAANTILARVSTRRARMVSVTCTPVALLLDLGDLVLIQDPVQRRQVLGEVAALQVSLDPTVPIGLDLIVAEESEFIPGETPVWTFAPYPDVFYPDQLFPE